MGDDDARSGPLDDAGAQEWWRWALVAVGMLVAIPASFLPERWRRAIGFERIPRTSGVLAGAAEAVAAVLLFLAGLDAALDRWLPEALPAAAQYIGETGDREAYVYAPRGVGLSVFLYYLFSVKALACVYFLAEGLVRAVAAGGGETHGLLPLWLLDLAGLAAWRRIADWRLGPIVPDAVTHAPGGASLTIESSRPRPWDDHLAIEVDGKYWRVVAREVRARAARRFVYHLEPYPAREVIRGVVHHDPEELLAKKK